MRILIADDEPLARQRLTKQLQQELQQSDNNITSEIFEAANGIEAVESVNNNSIDIALLDIRMPGMDGLEAARHISEQEHPPAIIFTTAYDEFAIKAFDAHAVAYLLKPIRQEQLKKALNACSRTNKVQLAALEEAGEEESVRTHISAHSRGKLVLIPVAEIDYFFAEHKYVTVFYQGREELIEESLKSLEDEFGETFLRIHRNALVRRERVEKLSKTSDGKTMLHLRDVESPLEVSRRHVAHVRTIMK